MAGAYEILTNGIDCPERFGGSSFAWVPTVPWRASRLSAGRSSIAIRRLGWRQKTLRCGRTKLDRMEPAGAVGDAPERVYIIELVFTSSVSTAASVLLTPQIITGCYSSASLLACLLRLRRVSRSFAECLVWKHCRGRRVELGGSHVFLTPHPRSMWLRRNGPDIYSHGFHACCCPWIVHFTGLFRCK